MVETQKGKNSQPKAFGPRPTPTKSLSHYLIRISYIRNLEITNIICTLYMYFGYNTNTIAQSRLNRYIDYRYAIARSP